MHSNKITYAKQKDQYLLETDQEIEQIEHLSKLNDISIDDLLFHLRCYSVPLGEAEETLKARFGEVEGIAEAIVLQYQPVSVVC